MKIYTVKIVPLSALVDTADVLDYICECISDVTWGDADHTLISRDRLHEQLNAISEQMPEISEVASDVYALADDVFIDLEN